MSSSFVCLQSVMTVFEIIVSRTVEVVRGRGCQMVVVVVMMIAKREDGFTPSLFVSNLVSFRS